MKTKIVTIAGQSYTATICPPRAAEGAFSKVSARPSQKRTQIGRDGNGMPHFSAQGLCPGKGLPF